MLKQFVLELTRYGSYRMLHNQALSQTLENMPAWLMAFKALNYITKDSKTLFCRAGHFGITDKTKTFLVEFGSSAPVIYTVLSLFVI